MRCLTGGRGGGVGAGDRAALSLRTARFCRALHTSQTATGGLVPLAAVDWTPCRQRTTGRQAVLAGKDPGGHARAQSRERAITSVGLRSQRWQSLH